MTEYKIKSSKSEAIYDILGKSLGVTKNYYEKEAFVYHHSVCNHDMTEFRLKLENRNDSKAKWSFKIGESTDKIHLKNPNELNQTEILEATAAKNKLNHLVNYVLNNGND